MHKSLSSRSLALAAVVAAFAASPLASIAADSASVAAADKTFMVKAAGGGLYEVEAGRMAAQKGQSQGVKDLGQMLVADHGKANDKLKALASQKGVSLPDAPPADKQAKLQKLDRSKDFDKTFIQQVGLADHKQDIALFDKASKGAKDPDVKQFAMETLPTLKAHRDHAAQLRK